MNSNNVFTITPMSQRVSLAPGQVYEGEITIINPANSESDFAYKAEVVPYSVIGEGYSADLATRTNYTMIVDWVKIDEPTGVLKPNGTKKIKYTITVPKDAPAGGQYAAVSISQDKSQGGQENGVSVNNIFEMASLIYADVAGETRRGGKIEKNEMPGFVTGAPITLKALVRNDGNVHENATVQIVARDFFTGAEIIPSKDDNNFYSELVMPETTRLIEREISENLPTLGVVHVEQIVSFNGAESSIAKNVIICPIWFLILIAVTLVAIVTVVVRIIVKHKKNKKDLDLV